MLDLAINHVDDVNKLFRKIATEEKYKYYAVNGNAELVYVPKTDNWNKFEYVSINSKGNVTGFITVIMDRPYGSGTVIVMNTGSIEIMKDLSEVVDKFFLHYNFPYITFSVLIGNRAEIMYDRFIENNGGRVVGIRRKCCIALDNIVYDKKLYEIVREDYIKSKEGKNE